MTWRRNNLAVPPPTFFLRLDSSFLLRAMFPRIFLVFELKATFCPPFGVCVETGRRSLFFLWPHLLPLLGSRGMAMPKIHQRLKKKTAIVPCGKVRGSIFTVLSPHPLLSPQRPISPLGWGERRSCWPLGLREESGDWREEKFLGPKCGEAGWGGRDGLGRDVAWGVSCRSDNRPRCPHDWRIPCSVSRKGPK